MRSEGGKLVTLQKKVPQICLGFRAINEVSMQYFTDLYDVLICIHPDTSRIDF